MNSKETRFEMLKKHHSKTYQTAKKQGKVDEEFISHCDFILKTENYFTSSCCAGRIALVGLGKTESKTESAFHRKWHRTVKFEEVKKGIEKFNGEVLWFKQEPLILHIGTNKLENAKKMLKIFGKVGLKRSGINVAKEGKFILEVVGSHNINVPVKEGKIIIDDEYLKYLVKKANEKFKKNQKSLKELTKETKKVERLT